MLNALLLVDSILTQANQKKILVGLFNRFTFPSFPAQAPPWFIFAAAENLEGHNTFTLRITLPETGEVVFSIAGEIEVADRSSGVELPVQVPSLRFRKEGAYLLEFLINGSPAGTRVFQVVPSGTEAH